MTTLFDDVTRHDMSPAAHDEDLFSFLNRVGGPFWQRVRELLEDWFSRFPVDGQADLRARFRSPDRRSTYAAHWELYLHEAFIRHGFGVRVHASVDGTNKTPDFMIEREDQSIYVEATCFFDEEFGSPAARRRARLYDTINRLDEPNFVLWIDVIEDADTSPAGAQLRRSLQQWLTSLDYDEVASAYRQDGLERLPGFSWTAQDWVISFRAIPKRSHARGRGANPVLGVFGSGRFRFVDDKTPIRSRLKAKAARYGRLSQPFLIALSCHSMKVDEISFTDALYGDEAVQVRQDAGGDAQTRWVRQPKGFWCDRHGPINRRVSGVLIVNDLAPWSIPKTCPVLWHHPFARYPIQTPFAFASRRLDLHRQTLVSSDGEMPMHDLFNLPLDWPGPENPF